jgi:hypothetical protein
VSVPYVYDAGALTAIDGTDRRMWAIHHLALEEGRRVIVPAVVVGQVWRDGRRQVTLGRFLRTCETEPTLLEGAKGPAFSAAARAPATWWTRLSWWWR